MKTFSISLLLACLLTCSASCLFANSAPPHAEPTSGLLVLSHQYKAKYKTFEEDIPITIKMKDRYHKRLKGRLTIESDSSISVDGKTVLLEDIASIRIPVRPLQVIGGILGGGGAGFSLGGIALLIGAENSDSFGTALAAAILGLASFFFGLLLMLIGIPLLFAGKKFKLWKNWDASIG